MLSTGTAAGNPADTDNPASPPEEMEPARSDEEIRQSVEKYRQRVERLQAEHGAYHSQLSEAMLSLGLSLSALNEHTEAADNFRTALHISRVNHGLHNMDQLPYLELLIQENNVINNTEELYKNYHYLYWLHKRNYGGNDPRLLPVIYRVARWHLETYRSSPDIEPYKHLSDAKDLYNEAIEIIETEYSENDSRLITPLYELALSNYYVATQADREEAFRVETSYRRPVTRADYYEEDSAVDRILDSYFNGKEALDRIVSIHEANPDLSAESHAVALTYLGDWHMLFERPRSALDRYSDAYQLLADDATGSETIEQIFGAPRRLPTVPLPDQVESPPEEREAASGEETAPYAIVSFDVLSNGRARNIRVVESQPGDDKNVLRIARRTIASTKFRPRFEDGKPVKTTDVNLKYIINE